MSLVNQVDGGSTTSGGSFDPSSNSFITNASTTAPNFRPSPEKYDTIGNLIGEYAKPDIREQLVKTYGDQGITGFLKLTGAINAAATQDEVTYFEEGRRHHLLDPANTVANSSGVCDNVTFAVGDGPQLHDVLLDVSTGQKFLVVLVDVDNTAGGTPQVHMETLDGNTSNGVTANTKFVVLGNMYPQGSEQPKEYSEPGLVKRINPFMIIKDRYQVTGSAATNVGYVNLGGGDYRWYIKGEQEARAKFEDKREMMMLFAEENKIATTADRVATGSEGYFAAIANRGITKSGLSTSPFSAMSDIDDIIKELDKEGAPAEYAMYLNRTQDLAIDDLLANGIATQVTAGLAGQFGAFNNSADMAVELGFKSFTRGGYTFHKHDWRLLNDPTLLGAMSGTGSFQGAMVPMTQVVDPQSGAKAPALEMNYKASNGYSREMEHWVSGGGVLGFNNNGDLGKDVATFHYRSEINLITRAANQHVALKG
tara:strand:- start:19130 stop:20572 length:1443 start_codon:yes stop_codon:yes gene_type:complete